jgi:hypothetical protein
MGKRSYYGSRIGLSIGTLAFVFFTTESAMRLRGYYIQERIIGELADLDGRQLPPG